MTKHPSSTDSRILARIRGQGRGWVFTPSHFAGLGTRNAVASALKRHKSAGLIRCLARGLYDYPAQDPILGTIAPSSDAIARAIAVRHAIRLQPSGAFAVNILGLSTQVPSRIVLLTDGPTRMRKIGNRSFLFKHTSPKNMAAAGRRSGIYIQALRYLGRAQVDDQVIAILRRQVTDSDKAVILKDLHLAPAWIADVLRPLVSAVA